jgi:hypothetical protein
MKVDFFSDLKKEVLEIRDRHPHLSLDNSFVVWFLRAFITQSEDEAVAAVKGGANDKSTDAIYIDHISRLVFIIQGKYHQNSEPTAGRSDVLALADLGRALMLEKKATLDSILNKANSRVLETLSEARKAIHNKGFGLVLKFVTTGKISNTHLEEAEQRIEDFENTRYEGFTRVDLMKLMQDYLEGAAPPTPTLTIPIQGGELFSRFDTKTNIKSWIFSVSGKDIGEIFNDVGIRLFARNIRGYLGNTEINKVMRNTIDYEPEFFWYYNNGITITCDKAKGIDKGNRKVIQITNAQIINGQQTTRTLAQVKNNDAEVLVKLVEVPRKDVSEHQTFSKIISSIVSATNWQNAISQADLKSNDPEQVRIEKEMKKLNYFYIRKKMKKSEVAKYGGDRYSFRVKKEELARFLAAVNVDPYEVRLGKDRLFEDDIYSDIFDGRNVADYLTIYWLGKRTNSWVSTDNRYSYAKWIAVNYLWNLLGSDLKKIANREVFRKVSERPLKYLKEISILDKIIRIVLNLTISFYASNKRVDGRVQERIDFFKHKKYHIYFRDYIYKSQKSRFKRINHLKSKFITKLDLIEY